jgi:hypothetical protein
MKKYGFKEIPLNGVYERADIKMEKLIERL